MRGELVKISELTPESKSVSVLAKVVSIGERKQIMSRFGSPRYVAEAVVGDDTATIILSLWNEQIGTIAPEDIIKVENGYISLVRGRMRLNVGRYGKLTKTEESISEINTSVNMSDKEYEQPMRRERWQRRRF